MVVEVVVVAPAGVVVVVVVAVTVITLVTVVVVVVMLVVKAMVWSRPVVKMSVDVSTIDEWAGVVVINAVDAEAID